MMEFRCVDAGTEQCPCQLALTGDCLICDRLQGEDECDCNWAGVCPYTVFVQNGRRIGDLRKERIVRLVKRKDYEEGITVLVLDVGRGFAQKASLPGSFVFLRPATGNEALRSYDLPVSVMKADEAVGQIHLAIRREGPKSKMLLDRTTEQYAIRGVYHSGLQGREWLRSSYVKGKNVWFLTKGIGAAPAILSINRLSSLNDAVKNNDDQRVYIRWLADDTKLDRRLIEDYAGKDRTVEPEYLSLTTPSSPTELKTWRAWDRFPEVVVITGSAYFVETLSQVIRNEVSEAKIVTANNAKMCCGEGICGACTEVGPNGKVRRMCKCQE